MPWLIYKHTLIKKCKHYGFGYVGLTKQIPSNRWKNGNGYSRRKKDREFIFGKAIKKYGWNNFLHEIIEDNIPTLEKAKEREIYWIQYYNTYIGFKNCKGYNMTLGGDTGEHLGYPVYQINKDTMEIINEFPSSSEASRQFGKGENNASQIRRCCDGEKYSCKGYFWCYVKNYFNGWKPKDNELVSPIYQIDNKLNIIKRWESITDAHNNGYKGSIIGCCTRRQQKADGYYWCYVKDYNENWKPVEGSFKRNEPIYCLESNKEYINATEAGIQEKCNKSKILRCCKGLEIHTGGKHFCYVKDKEKFNFITNHKYQKQKPYTQEEIDFLIKYIPLKGNKWCAKELKRTEGSIVAFVHRNLEVRATKNRWKYIK